MAAVAQVRLRAGDGGRRAARAHALGLDAYGVSFHVGSQQTELTAWDRALAQTAAIFRAARRARHHAVRWSISAAASRRAISRTCRPPRPTARRSSRRSPSISATPSRRRSSSRAAAWSAMPASSRRKSCWSRRSTTTTTQRWVYLDIGKFGGLAETMEEAIRYPILTAARRRREGSLRARRPDLRFGRRALREDALRPAAVADGRRRGADRQAPAPIRRPTRRSPSTASSRCRAYVI